MYRKEKLTMEHFEPKINIKKKYEKLYENVFRKGMTKNILHFSKENFERQKEKIEQNKKEYNGVFICKLNKNVRDHKYYFLEYKEIGKDKDGIPLTNIYIRKLSEFEVLEALEEKEIFENNK